MFLQLWAYMSCSCLDSFHSSRYDNAGFCDCNNQVLPIPCNLVHSYFLSSHILHFPFQQCIFYSLKDSFLPSMIDNWILNACNIQVSTKPHSLAVSCRCKILHLSMKNTDLKNAKYSAVFNFVNIFR